MRIDPSQREYIEQMAKQLPPSASILRLLDVGGVCGEILLKLRQDIKPRIVSYNAEDWDIEDASVDAIVAYDRYLDPFFLRKSLEVLRPGGRLIVVHPHLSAFQSIGWRLERFGYTRLLVEYAIGYRGALIRGERSHTTPDTLERIQLMARSDLEIADLNTYRGRYVYLLVHQEPNKPVWRMSGNERIRWNAVAIQYDTPTYLAFSSLPNAVAFMQQAVLTGLIKNVNKMPKFSMDTTRHWQYLVMLNPSVEAIKEYEITSIEVDPESAEAPDE